MPIVVLLALSSALTTGELATISVLMVGGLIYLHGRRHDATGLSAVVELGDSAAMLFWWRTPEERAAAKRQKTLRKLQRTSCDCSKRVAAARVHPEIWPRHLPGSTSPPMDEDSGGGYLAACFDERTEVTVVSATELLAPRPMQTLFIQVLNVGLTPLVVSAPGPDLLFRPYGYGSPGPVRIDGLSQDIVMLRANAPGVMTVLIGPDGRPARPTAVLLGRVRGTGTSP